MSYVNRVLTVNEIYKQHRILCVNDLILLENYKIWFRHQHNHLPLNLQEVMKTDHKSCNLLKSHGYATRNKKEINLPMADIRTYRGSFLFKGLRDYQLLPLEVKSERNEKKFITKCKNYLINFQNTN